ncbi:MAG: LVIVD repeat-containing protein [Gemmatimonadaceae bacterium]
MTARSTVPRSPARKGLLHFGNMLALAGSLFAATAGAQGDSVAINHDDPRIGLRAGYTDAAEAARNLVLVGHAQRLPNFGNPQNLGDFAFLNGDLAFKGNYVYQGGFNGLQVWDISNPKNPTLRTSFVCPGGQGDPSIYKNLLFFSVEETRGRVDCGTQGVPDTVSAERFRGVRIFDVSDIDHPKQVAAVQTCRGSHTHTLVVDPNDPDNVYIYVSGTSVVRSGAELAGCAHPTSISDTTTSLFRIDIIKVPLAAPQNARVVNSPRIFADSLGAIAGLWIGGSHGPGTQNTTQTNMCHDITVYSAIGLAAGACSGNGILLDIRDPVHPKRIAAVMDPNFAYWHSATFNNDGTKVVFTDEWGGGMAPRCRPTDKLTWGADAIFNRTGDKMTPAGYYKLPVAQTDQENCVAHNGSLIPVPGRDIMTQAWYQGGVSVFDFTDPAHPKEIAFFDRGPMDSTKLLLGGDWGTYWYNGYIYASEIDRGLDILDLKPSDQLSQNEIDAAKLIHFDVFNPQNQPKLVWPASYVVARAYLDQLVRDKGVTADQSSSIARDLSRAEKLKGASEKAALASLATRLDRDAKTAADPTRVAALAAEVRDLGKR